MAESQLFEFTWQYIRQEMNIENVNFVHVYTVLVMQRYNGRGC